MNEHDDPIEDGVETRAAAQGSEPGGKPKRPPAGEHLRKELGTLPLWKKLALALAGVFMLAGGALATLGDDPAPAPAQGVSGTAGTTSDGTPARGARGNHLTGEGIDLGEILRGGGEAGGTAPPAGSEPESESMWTPFLLKGGFSFFVAFCIGFALRAFFKVSALALGSIFLILFLLSYVGVVQVDWDTLGGWFDSARSAASEEFASFRSFISGSLPSAASATLGLVAGFKR